MIGTILMCTLIVGVFLLLGMMPVLMVYALIAGTGAVSKVMYDSKDESEDDEK